MNQINAMRAFVRVAETNSFRRAAQQLDVSNALVTRSIAMLEAHLQTRLINRTTRNLALTEAGNHYLDGCRGLLEELDHLERSVTQTEREPGGTLRVVASGTLSMLALTPLIDGFRKRFPNVNVRLTLAEKRVDLIEDGFDVGIVTAYMVTSKELIERKLASNAFVACAAPSYLEIHDSPDSPADLARHAFVGLPPEQRNPTWHFTGPDGQTQRIQPTPVYSVNNALMVRFAAVAGMGVAILPSQLVAEDFAAGALKRIMPDYEVDDPEVKVSVVYPSRQYLPARTRAFVDYAVDYFEQALPVTPPTIAALLDTLHAVPGT